MPPTPGPKYGKGGPIEVVGFGVLLLPLLLLFVPFDEELPVGVFDLAFSDLIS